MPEKPVAQPVQGSALLNLIKIRLLEFTRKPEAIFWTYGFPLLMVVVLGIAFRSQPKEKLFIAVQESPQAANIVQLLQANDELVLETVSANQAKQKLRSGKVSAVVIPHSSSSSTEDSNSPSPNKAPLCDILVDYARPNSQLAELSIRMQLQKSMNPESIIAAQSISFDEPGSRYIDFLVPGLIGMSLLGGGMWGVGYAIVDMRIRKLLKRFLATPMRRTDFLMGVMISRLLFMLPEILLMLAFTTFFFGIKVYGSWLSLAFLILLGGIQFSGVGLLVASRAKSLEAISGLMNMVMLPMWTLCGIFFSYENFPEIVHWPIRLLPLTPLLDSLRGVMLDGKPLSALWVELTIMTIWSVVTFTLALKIFRWNV